MQLYKESNPEDSMMETERSGVLYKYKCQDCDQICIGETERTIPARVKEHLRNPHLGYIKGNHQCQNRLASNRK